MTLVETIKRYIDNAEYERTHGNLQGCLEFKQLAEWLKELKRFREQTRWIPVSERLPEKTGRYLCTVGAEYRNPREMYYAPQEWANKSDAATWRSIDGSYVYDWFVKAWMPLPEPYKETEDRK